MTPEEARGLFGRRRAAWLAEDVDAYLGLFTADLVIELPGRDPLDHEAYARLVRGSFAATRPVEFVFHRIDVADDDTVHAAWTITVERRDTGATVTWEGTSECHIRDGRIAWWREEYADPAALAAAMR